RDFDAFVETLALRRKWDAMPADERAAHCVKLVDQGLGRSPFAIALVDAALNAAPDWKTASAVLDAFAKEVAEIAKDKKYALYMTTVRDLAHARIEQLPAPSTPGDTARLLEALERQGCANGALLARCWRGLGGDDEFVKRCKAGIEAYLASPERTKDKRASQRFAAEVNGWAKTVKQPARKRWAEQLLESFEGKEVLTIKGKESVDPAVEALRKVAGLRTPPKK
ncbi:MAG: hypothetical protein RL325_329, partial [Planctomycetota bacterium]